MPTPVFEARNLQVVRGGSLILNVPSLIVGDGEIFFVIGPNGAGKSTLLQALAALTKSSGGDILFRGKKIGVDIPVLEYRRKLAMILQEPLLFDTTVYHNVASGLKIRGMKREKIKPIVDRTMERFGISHLKDRSARTLSGGEARRTSIARAFATNPEVLLMDEPFAALDPIIRETLMIDLERVLQDTRITTIFVTHDRTEAFRLASRLGVMNAGEILQTGSPEEVMYHPVNAFVASLVGMENILQGEVTERIDDTFLASVSGQNIEAAGNMDIGKPVTLCIRSEHVSVLSCSADIPSETKNLFHGKVEKITPMGVYHKVQLNCGFQLTAYVTNHFLSAVSLGKGAEVFVSFDVNAVHVIFG